VLNLDATASGIHNAAELGQNAVAGPLDDASPMLGNFRLI
jgi:hypothetical protein